MTKKIIAKKQPITNKTNYGAVLDLGSLLLALLFLASVIKNAAVVSGSMPIGGWGATPAAYALIAGLILLFISWYQSKGKVSIMGAVALAVLLSSAAIWIFGLHAAWPIG